MAIQLNDNLNIQAPKPVDTRLVQNTISDVYSINSAVLYNGLQVLVLSDYSTWRYNGVTWSQVITGITGSTGYQGFQGYQGFIGGTGIQGYQGYQGDRGVTGFQGFQGYQGLIGNTGIQGFQGYQGPASGGTGAQGYQGIKGVTGFQGYQGFQGSIGVTGSFTFSVTSYGVTGVQGYQGYQGYGFQGYQGTGVTGAQGYQGIPGPTGSGGSSRPLYEIFLGTGASYTSSSKFYFNYSSFNSNLGGGASLVSGNYSSILAGAYNYLYNSKNSVILGGNYNCQCYSSDNSIITGKNNFIRGGIFDYGSSGKFNSIVSGYLNSIGRMFGTSSYSPYSPFCIPDSNSSVITGGIKNSILGHNINSNIIGGGSTIAEVGYTGSNTWHNPLSFYHGNVIYGHNKNSGIFDSDDSLIFSHDMYAPIRPSLVEGPLPLGLPTPDFFNKNTIIEGTCHSSIISMDARGTYDKVTFKSHHPSSVIGNYNSVITGGSGNLIYSRGLYLGVKPSGYCANSNTNVNILGGNNNLITKNSNSNIIGGSSNCISFWSHTRKPYSLWSNPLYANTVPVSPALRQSYSNSIIGSNYTRINYSYSSSILSSDNSYITGFYNPTGKGMVLEASRNSSIIGSDCSYINGSINSLILGSKPYYGYNNFIHLSYQSSIISSVSVCVSNSSGSSIISSKGYGGVGYTLMSGGFYSSIISSCNSCINSGEFSSIIGSYYSYTNGSYASIISGGSNNKMLSNIYKSAIIGGSTNCMINTVFNSSIISGSTNTITGTQKSVIVGGEKNILSGVKSSSIVGGYMNTIDSNSINSVIIGGQHNDIHGFTSSAIIGGVYLTQSQHCNVLMPRIETTDPLDTTTTGGASGHRWQFGGTSVATASANIMLYVSINGTRYCVLAHT
jgi:Collagen triple helix repeat (20 copies)